MIILTSFDLKHQIKSKFTNKLSKEGLINTINERDLMKPRILQLQVIKLTNIIHKIWREINELHINSSSIIE